MQTSEPFLFKADDLAMPICNSAEVPALQGNELGDHVRLEQERVRYSAINRALSD